VPSLIYSNPPKGLINLKGFATFLGLARVCFITLPLEFFNPDLGFLAIGRRLAGCLKGYLPPTISLGFLADSVVSELAASSSSSSSWGSSVFLGLSRSGGSSESLGSLRA